MRAGRPVIYLQVYSAHEAATEKVPRLITVRPALDGAGAGAVRLLNHQIGMVKHEALSIHDETERKDRVARNRPRFGQAAKR